MTGDLAGFERAAAELLPADALAYFATGARDEVTLRSNVAAWSSWAFLPRVLVDVSRVLTATTALGTPVWTPILVAPMAAQRLAHPDGELATARAAAAAGSIMVVSTSTTVPIETLTAVEGLTVWFQLYPFADRARTVALVRRAEAAGARAVVLTVDVPIDVSTHRRPWAFPAGLSFALHDGMGAMVTGMDWDYLTWLQGQTSLPVVPKGVLHPDDARRAVAAGCPAVIVSNHGGRQLDGAVPTAEILPEVAEAVDGAAELYVDGGVRRGADVLRALALGSRAVLVGRPVLWGLAAGGEAGVRRVLAVLAEELVADAALAGVADLRRVPRDLVRRRLTPQR